jgi:uncharacterized Zn-binding protein involved in type VI secretion
MRKAAVRHGDPTTTRGVVLAYSSTIHDDGKQVALSGDEATCGDCKGLFKIFGTGEGMSEKGRVVVVEGDQVLCPCKKNRVIVGSSPGIFLEITGGSARASSVAATASPSQAVDEAKHSRWCLVRDGVTGESVANRDFVADIGGRSQYGKTDGQGYAKIESNGEQLFNIHVIFSSPKRVLKPRQGN